MNKQTNKQTKGIGLRNGEDDKIKENNHETEKRKKERKRVTFNPGP